MKKVLLILSGWVWLSLAACDRSPPAQSVSMGEYTLLFSHRPDPLQVGFDAKLEATINDKSGKKLRNCTAGFRQFMPEMEMSHDHDLFAMPVSGDGVYSGTTKSFSMGGEWVLELTIDCGAGPINHSFTYQLEWPE